MLDLHCHLLPGIDDGPETLAQALELAQIAVDHGTTHAVVTPHIHPGRYENEKANIQEAFRSLNQAIGDNNINLKLGFAAEVRLSDEILPQVLDARIPYYGTLDNEHIMLLECPHSHIPPGSDKLVEWLLKQNIRPMIAHPERNKDVMRSAEKLDAFIRLGCLFQITADSVAGLFGENAQYRAHQLISEGHATVLASDGHNAMHRPPRLDRGLEAAKQLIGDKAATKLVYDNPLAIAGAQFE